MGREELRAWCECLFVLYDVMTMNGESECPKQEARKTGLLSLCQCLKEVYILS
jgi:hypothetical protein